MERRDFLAAIAASSLLPQAPAWARERTLCWP
ncbi:hypothetical protein QE400_001175 [Xanthomonas sacchari]|nr:hypothetical protein [Xanthomonas sacchari]